MLSMIAALQAPIIMMARTGRQRRFGSEDGINYETNAHAAAEIDLVQEKLDLLLDILRTDNQIREGARELITRSKIN